MKYLFPFFFVCFLLQQSLMAQVNIEATVNVNLDRKPISPYIYGTNNDGQAMANFYGKETFRRQGGNNLSGYNWETNFSHAGPDWYFENYRYLPWYMGIPSNMYNTPGIVLTKYIDTSNAIGAQVAITLPMVGYVAADENGEVLTSELAPSPRWKQVVFRKQAPFSLTPNLNDAQIYVDEQINFLINRYGNSSTLGGVKNYILDNEPGLWGAQFQRMRSSGATYAELFYKSIQTASVVKDMDPNAKVFGPELWGFTAYWNLQFASDAGNYSSDHWFIDTYLKAMETASDTAGRRLLDVFTVHYYPQADVSIYSDNISIETCRQRVQNPRVWWDSTYAESGWIWQSGFGNEYPLIPHIKQSIQTFFPGTAFGITEYDFGAHAHISGGIAQADALGVLGKWGVDYANIWGSVSGFTRTAFDLYLDYDGQGSTFGNTSVFTTVSDNANFSLYASVTSVSNDTLHLIAINKSDTELLQVNFTINSNKTYHQAAVYYFNNSSENIQSTTINSIVGNSFLYNISPFTVTHLVLVSDNSGIETPISSTHIQLYPNPTTGIIQINSLVPITAFRITDIQGKTIILLTETSSDFIDIHSLPSGVYILTLYDGKNILDVQKIVLTNGIK